MSMMQSSMHTMQGLLKWSKTLFEKLGWMVLTYSHSRGNMYSISKIQNYKESIKECIMEIQVKINQVQEKDRRDDLQITLNNLMILQQTVDGLFPIQQPVNGNQVRTGGKKNKN